MSIQVMNEEGKAVRLITPRAGKTPGQVQILTEVAAGIVSMPFLTFHTGKKSQDACWTVHLIGPSTRSRCMWSRNHIWRKHDKQWKWESAIALTMFPRDHVVQDHLLSRRKTSKSKGEFGELHVIRGIPGLLFLTFISGHEVGAWSQACILPYVCLFVCLGFQIPNPRTNYGTKSVISL